MMKYINLLSIVSVTLPHTFGYIYDFPRFLEPEDVGMAHTEVIQDLHQRMRDQPPSNKDEYLDHMTDAVIEYMCQPFTEECVDRILETTDNIDMTYTSGFEHISYNLVPENFDPLVLESIEKLFNCIGQLRWDESPKNLLQEMYVNFEQLMDDELVEDERHRMVGLVAYSVGMESAKQWHDILNEPNNEFHKLIATQKSLDRRKLQDEEFAGLSPGDILTNVQSGQNNNIDPVDLVEADVVGSAAGAIMGGFDIVEGENSTVMEVVVESAILYSATNIVEQFAPASSGGGIVDNIIDGVTNTDNDGIFSGIIGGIGGGNNNETDSGGGGLFSGLVNGITGNNNNDNNETDSGGGGLFSGLVSGITGNNNDVPAENTTIADNGESNGTNATNSADSGAVGAGGTGTGTGATVVAGAADAVTNIIGGFLGGENSNNDVDGDGSAQNTDGNTGGGGLFSGIFGGGGNTAATRQEGGV